MTQYAGAAWNQLMENESKESIAELYLASIARERGMREALESIAALGDGEKHAKAKLYGAVETARAALASGQPPGKEGGV